MMDVVYIVRPGDDNEELRYSLRSLEANYPHGRVCIVGYLPSWVTEVMHIDGNRAGNPHANVYQNIQLACWDDRLTDDIVIMNDDFYITEPITGIPNWYRSTLDEHLDNPRVRGNGGWWKKSLEATRIALQSNQISNALSYELHIPIVLDRYWCSMYLNQYSKVTPDNPPQWRTIYGNCHHGLDMATAQRHSDCKAYGPHELHKPFHSTDDTSFRWAKSSLQKMFPNKCRYEA